MDKRDRRRQVENSRRMFHISRTLTRQMRRPPRREDVEDVAAKGVEGMDLMGLVRLFSELAADAADAKDLRKAIGHYAEEWGFSDDLTAILENSIELVEREIQRGRPGDLPR